MKLLSAKLKPVAILVPGALISSRAFAGTLDSSSSTSDSSDTDSSSASAPGAASSAYSAINQLTQSGMIPLAFSPFSVSA